MTGVARGDIHYAKSGDLSIAYTVFGDGPDLLVALGFISHLDLIWEERLDAHFFSRLASFRRVITFDKRATGLSDPAAHAPTLEECVDDMRAVMEAAGSERADVFGISEGGTMAMLLAAPPAAPGQRPPLVGAVRPPARGARLPVRRQRAAAGEAGRDQHRGLGRRRRSRCVGAEPAERRRAPAMVGAPPARRREPRD